MNSRPALTSSSRELAADEGEAVREAGAVLAVPAMERGSGIGNGAWSEGGLVGGLEFTACWLFVFLFSDRPGPGFFATQPIVTSKRAAVTRPTRGLTGVIRTRSRRSARQRVV